MRHAVQGNARQKWHQAHVVTATTTKDQQRANEMLPACVLPASKHGQPQQCNRAFSTEPKLCVLPHAASGILNQLPGDSPEVTKNRNLLWCPGQSSPRCVTSATGGQSDLAPADRPTDPSSRVDCDSMSWKKTCPRLTDPNVGPAAALLETSSISSKQGIGWPCGSCPVVQMSRCRCPVARCLPDAWTCSRNLHS